MDFNLTSTKRRAGFSLVETMVVTVIGSLMMAAIAALSNYTGRSFAAMVNYTDLDKLSRNALDTMSKEIRQTSKLTAASTTSLMFQDYDGQSLSYTYNRDARTLTRTKTGEPSKILLKGCDELTFSIYQRNPIGGTYNVYPTATPATCKLIQLRWTCSRDLIRSKVNTESVQSAKIVIRKQ
jgi:prepilin-type N-terminal cleavage/methylation domain-containing protein